MALRDDLILVVDGARDLVEGLGLRLHATKVVTRTWTGSQPGSGSSSVAELVLDPKPKVRPPHPGELATAAGRYEDGDQLVTKISATYTRAQLGDGDIAANAEVYWTIDGERYRLVCLAENPFGWEAYLRRMRRRA